MMTNLFLTFDPSTNMFNLSLNWTSTFLGLLLIPSLFWLTPSRINIIWNKLNLTLHNEFKTLLGPKSFNGTTFIFISIFIMMLFNNFMGLFPYIFTSTSHLALTFAIALPMWLSFMLFGWINHTNHMFTHLVPQGTPPALMSFMVLIETISNVIRPGTLAVRLAANMIAGHLLLMESNHTQALQGLFFTVLLGLYFTMLQAYEYWEAPFTIADAVYGSTFFVATGFHGLHVIIGTIFLSTCLLRHSMNQFSPSHHFGFEAAAWYWHFVDVVWLFLYISIYWWGS